MGFSEILTQWTALVGMAALIAVIINLLKLAGVVRDGDAQTWSAGLNLVGLTALFVLKVFKAEIDLGTVDKQVGELASTALVILGYISQLLASKATHLAVKNVPLIGKSLAKQEPGEAEQYRSQMAQLE